MMQMLKLLPDQAAKYWDVIKPVVEMYRPNTAISGPDTVNGILTAILSGKIEFHIYYKQSDNGTCEDSGIKGFAMLSILDSIEESYKHMLIYFMYSLPGTSMKDMLRGWELTVKYAKGRGCKIINGYTRKEDVKDLVKHLGGDVSTTWFFMEV